MNQIDDNPEYKAMRKGLMALRLEAPPLVCDDLLSLCEQAVQSVKKDAYEAGCVDGFKANSPIQ